MSEIFSSLQTLMVDHIRLSLMSQIQNNKNVNMPQLIILAIVVGAAAWLYDSVTGENSKGIRNISLDFRSYFMRKRSIKLEGKHVTGIEMYSRRPIVISNTFSKSFRAVLFHAIKNIDSMCDVRELKEFATNLIKGDNNDDKLGEDLKTIFTISQRYPFMINKELEIYCSVMEAGEQREQGNEPGFNKNDSRVVRIVINLFSYTTRPAQLKEYVSNLTKEYSKYLEDKRRGKIFIYTLNNTEVHNEDDDDTVGGWRETPHETMKSFDNIFFEGKPDILKKVQFFTDNKEWYRKNGVPYTLGLALYGSPGTGKTSFIKAIASLLGRHIISISLAKIKTKKQLYDFYYETQYNSSNDKNAIGFDKKIIVFEDIDCVGDIVKNRKSKDSPSPDCEFDNSADESGSVDLDEFLDANPSSGAKLTPEEKVKHEIAKATKYVLKKMSSDNAGKGPFGPNMNDNITLDDLLNLWDGIRENTGRIMIITTNHYDKLDPALIRPGRIDIALNLENASRITIAEMYSHYYGEAMDPNDLALIPDRFYSPAEVINFYVSNHENPRAFIERLVLEKKV